MNRGIGLPHCRIMMLPALSVMVFWLLSGSGGKGAQREILFAPFIRLDPVQGVKLGGTAEIQCSVPFSDYVFHLEPEIPRLLISVTEGFQRFSINNVSREDGGKYTCYSYNPNTHLWSESSKPVELLIEDPDLPRPNISMSTSKWAAAGSNVTIRCWAKGPIEKFYLQVTKTDETERLIQVIEPDGDMAEFFIRMSWVSSGRFSCLYKPPSGFITSMRSNSVELLLLDTNTPVSISLSPSDRVDLGANIIIRCLANERSKKTFYLEKAGGQIPLKLETDKINATFLIVLVNWEHGGEYSCRYVMGMTMSQSSDPVELLIRDPDLPRPNISLSPNSVTFLGSNVTIYCWTEGLNNTFYLHKAGEQKASQSVEPEGGKALFRISNVSLTHAGSYSCSYRPLKLFKSSENSNNVELLVLDPSCPRPAISVSPRRLVALGGQVEICCETEDGPAHFFLSKNGDPTLKWPMKSNWDVGEFSFSNFSWELQGNYSCSYALWKRPFVFSPHSDPLELLVTESATYANINTIRLVIGALVLLLLAYLAITDHQLRKEYDEPTLFQPHRHFPLQVEE